MKAILLPLALFLLALRSAAADPTTFDEYKKLSANERQALFANKQNPLFGKFLVWQSRLDVGEESWQRRQLERLADAHGFTELKALFVHYGELRKEYFLDEGRRLEATKSAATHPAREDQWFKDYNSVDGQYMEILRLYAVLAPSPQAQALNSQANDLLDTWLKRFPAETGYKVTKPQMAELEQQVQQMVAQLKTLPKLTPQEAQAAIAGLPDDHLR